LGEITILETTVDRVINDQVVLMNCEKNAFHTLNETSSFTWNLIKEGTKNKDDLIDRIVEEYDVEKKTAEEDLDELLRGLEENGIIHL